MPFCDQDDVWFPEKIEKAVDYIAKNDGDVPVRYHSGYEITDENLNTVSYYKKPNYEYDFRRCLTGKISIRVFL